MPLTQLPSSTIKLIGSSQVITSVSSAVKELMENSIDASATFINIKLEKHGLEKIEVKDDGCGISHTDTPFMCLPNYTSKITDFSDLANLNSYGFRGEALSSLCAVAQVSVTTKTADDDIAMCYTLDNNGQVRSAKISQLLKGTVVTVTDIFKCLPVRKQLMSSSRRANEELKKVETVIKSLAVIHPKLRVTFIHNKFMIWQKTSVSSLRQSISQVISHSIIKQLHYLTHRSEMLKMEFLIPKRDCDVASVCISTTLESSFLFINYRPVRDKKIEKVVLQKILQYFGHYIPTNKHPIFISSLILPQDTLDVNLEPNKSKVFIQNQEQVLNYIDEELSLYYQKTEETEKTKEIDSYKTTKRRKLDPTSTVETNNCMKDSKNICLNLNGSQGNQKTVELNESVTQCDDFTDTMIDLADNIESENCANNTFDVSHSGSNNEVMCEEIAVKDTKSDFLKSELTNKSENDLFNILNNDFYDFNKVQEYVDVETTTDISTGNDSELISNTETLSFNTLLHNSKSKSTKNVLMKDVVEKSNEPLIIESQECNGFGTSNEQSKVNLTNISDFNIDNVTETNTIDFITETPTYSQWSRGEVLDCDPVQILKSNINGISSKPNQTLYSVSSPGITDHSVASQLSVPSVDSKSEQTLSPISSPSIIDHSIDSQVNVKSDVARINSKSEQILSPVSSPNLVDHSVASQMGQKEMAAFTKFTREMRSKILQETPGMSFTKVAGELANKWRSLQDDKKEKYEKEVEEEKRKKKLQSHLKPKIQQTTLNCFNKMKFKRPSMEVECTLDDLKNICNTPKIELPDDRFGLVNQIEASPLWVYYNGHNLKIISALRLQEAVTFHKHMSEFKIPLKPLEQPWFITSLDIEPNFWKLLLNLETQSSVITDLRIANNGFSIEMINQDSETKFMVTHIPLNIKYYDLEDLCEILKLIENNGFSCSLLECRPLKVRNFIRNEAFRECYSKEMVSDLSKMKELLFYWIKNIQPHSEVCIHDNAVGLTVQ